MKSTIELCEQIERAFAGRIKPDEVIEADQYIQFDSDIKEALWFVGRDWRDIMWHDWQEHPAAFSFFSRDALAYYLPSVLLLSLQRPQEALHSASCLISMLDWSPSAECWTDDFRRRFLGLRSKEYDAIKEWILYISDFENYRIYGTFGPGDIFGRAFDTVSLAQQETVRIA